MSECTSVLPPLPMCLEAQPVANLPSAFPDTSAGWVLPKAGRGVPCVSHLLMDQWAPVSEGHLHPFQSHPISVSLSPMTSTLEGHYLLHGFRASGKFLRVDRVSVPRDVLEQLLGNWRIPSCLFAARKGSVATVGS